MSKKIIIILIIITLLFQIYKKSEFLFFKVQVCNETSEKINVSIEWNRESFFDFIKNINIIEKIFLNYKKNYTPNNILLFTLEPKKCTKFYNTYPFTKRYVIDVDIITNEENPPIKCYFPFNYDQKSFINNNLEYWNHTFIIKKFKIYKNNLCRFHYDKL